MQWRIGCIELLLLVLRYYCHFFTCKCLNLFVKSLHAAVLVWKTNKVIKDFDLIDWLIDWLVDWLAVDSRNPPNYHSGCRKDNEGGMFKYIVGKVQTGFVHRHIRWESFTEEAVCKVTSWWQHVCVIRRSCLCMSTHLLSLLSGLNWIKGRWMWTIHFLTSTCKREKNGISHSQFICFVASLSDISSSFCGKGEAQKSNLNKRKVATI